MIIGANDREPRIFPLTSHSNVTLYTGCHHGLRVNGYLRVPYPVGILQQGSELVSLPLYCFGASCSIKVFEHPIALEQQVRTDSDLCMLSYTLIVRFDSRR